MDLYLVGIEPSYQRPHPTAIFWSLAEAREWIANSEIGAHKSNWRRLDDEEEWVVGGKLECYYLCSKYGVSIKKLTISEPSIILEQAQEIHSLQKQLETTDFHYRISQATLRVLRDNIARLSC